MVEGSAEIEGSTSNASRRIAVVTGGAQGIGGAIVAKLLEQGFDVAIADLDLETAERRTEEHSGEPRCRAFALDVADPASVEAAIAAIVADLGSPSILVNNAGIADYDPLEALSLERWQRTLAVNLTGPFLCTKAILPHLPPKGGSIVNISSVAARLGTPGTSAYAASKNGLIGLTRVMAIELAERGVRVNAVGPGVVRTPMSESVDPEQIDLRLRRTPLSRMSDPSEIAAAVAFLADEDSSFITGQVLMVDGGWTAQSL